MLKKILICPYFGDFPPWMGEFIENAKTIKKYGYDILIDTDLEGFKKRVKRVLKLDCPVVWGSSKVSDFRGSLGLLYEEEIKDYDYWGFTDFDMVFGDVGKWFPDEELGKLDVWSNHPTYVCGPWTLLKNTEEVRTLFMKYPEWREKMMYPSTNGWVEQEYSRVLEESGLKYKYSFFQGDPFNPPFNLKMVDGKLYQDGEEIAMLHFRRHKVWPLPTLML